MSGYNALVWMKVATGGKWTLPELYRELPSIGQKHINGAVKSMLESGALKHYDGGKFGVVMASTVPRGVTVGDVLACTGARV